MGVCNQVDYLRVRRHAHADYISRPEGNSTRRLCDHIYSFRVERWMIEWTLAVEKMHTILDLDLDVFSWPAVKWPRTNARPSDEDHVCASAENVSYFLERQCALSKVHKIPGQEFSDHDDAFYAWRRWIEEESLSPPSSIVHVDAHADMGIGDAGYLSEIAKEGNSPELSSWTERGT